MCTRAGASGVVTASWGLCSAHRMKLAVAPPVGEPIKMRRRLPRPVALAIAVVLIATSCGGAATLPPAGVTTAAAQALRPAFVTTQLTDVRTGERFTLGDFPGKVVLGLAMAVW